MSNETYWALKRREWAGREARSTRRQRRTVPLRLPAPRPIPAETLEAAAADVLESNYGDPAAIARAEPSYRDLQAQAKALTEAGVADIKGNLPADELKAAIEEASEE